MHTVVGTTAKDSDMLQFSELLHGEEARVSADRGYDYPQVHKHLQQTLTEDWVALKSKPHQPLDTWTRGLNHAIAKLRAIGEHPFRIVKRQFGYTKVRYRGLGEEHGSTDDTVCALQPVSGQANVTDIRGVVAQKEENHRNPW